MTGKEGKTDTGAAFTTGKAAGEKAPAPQETAGRELFDCLVEEAAASNEHLRAIRAGVEDLRENELRFIEKMLEIREREQLEIEERLSENEKHNRNTGERGPFIFLLAVFVLYMGLLCIKEAGLAPGFFEFLQEHW